MKIGRYSTDSCRISSYKAGCGSTDNVDNVDSGSTDSYDKNVSNCNFGGVLPV